MGILELISSDNYIAVNKSLIKIVGLEAAVLLGNLASEYTYWEERDGLKDGFFFSTVENIEDKTGLTSYQQRQAINKLVGLKIVEVKKMGIPAKRYIRISEQQVVKVLNDKKLKNCTTVGEKTERQQVKKLHSNNNINNKNIEQEKSKKEIKKKDAPLEELLDSVDVIKSNPKLRQDFIDFIDMRKKIKHPLDSSSLKRNINECYKLAAGDPELMSRILDQSIRNEYRGVFPLKEERPRPIPKPEDEGNEFTAILRAEGYI